MRRAVLAAALVATASAAAAYEVEVGFGGGYRTAAWTPVAVSGGDAVTGDTLFVWAEDPDGQFVRSPPGTETTGADGRPQWRFLVRFGRPSGRLRIERRAAAAPVGSAEIMERQLPEPLPSTTRIVLVAGDLPGLGDAIRGLARDGAPRPRLLPLVADGRTAAGGSARDFDAADAIVVCGRAAERLAADVRRGIDAWTRLGGRLVLIAGQSAAGLPAEAAAWLPAPVERLATVRRFGGLETHARAGRMPPRVSGGVEVPLFATGGTIPGIVDVWEGPPGSGTPLLVRRCHGLGTIVWLGVDLDAEPFRDWPGSVPLLAGLLGGRPEPIERETVGGPTTRDADLAGQLRTAVERFPAAPLTPVPFELVTAIGLLYVLCLYPLDWWLVSRAAGRPWVAWLTQAALVAAFTGLAWGVHAARRPATAGPLATSVSEVVDIDAAGGTVRGRGWAAIHADANDRLGVALAIEPPDADVAVSWWGDAGRGFAAVDAAMPHPALAAADYAYADALAALVGVPIAAASTRLFEADWQAAREPAATVTADLAVGPQDTLRGTVAHHLPFALEDCRLVHAGWLYDVGRLEPGQRYDTAAGRGPRSLAAALTRRAAAKERDVAARWNPAEADAERILEVAGFHVAAGGETYTLVPGGRLARLDLSGAAGLDRAVLVGFAPRGQATWAFAETTARARGLYRIVVPVAAAAADVQR
jgi:hypothetical protein